MSALANDAERIPRDTAAATDRRARRKLPLFETLLSSASPLAIILRTEL